MAFRRWVYVGLGGVVSAHPEHILHEMRAHPANPLGGHGERTLVQVVHFKTRPVFFADEI